MKNLIAVLLKRTNREKLYIIDNKSWTLKTYLTKSNGSDGADAATYALGHAKTVSNLKQYVTNTFLAHMNVG